MTAIPQPGILEQMAGVGDGVRDALTRYAGVLTGRYYVVPSAAALGRLRSDGGEGE